MNSWEFYSRIEMFKHAQKNDELAHYGITGQKWGQRRWQYADGRFNPEGKERYFGTKSKKEKSSDTGVKDYIKYKNENTDQKQKFGSTYFWNDDTRRVHNDSYQNADGSLTRKGEKLLAKSQNGNEKAANKIKAKALIDMDLYNEYNKENENSGKQLAHPDDPHDSLTVDRLNAIRKLYQDQENQKFGSSEYDPDSHMKHFKMWNDVGKKIKTDGGNVRAIFESNEDLYDDNAQSLILKNADKIHDMDKALQKGNDNKYFKVRNSFDNDYEKDLAELFVGDKRSLDDYNDLVKDANKKLSKKRINVQDYDESEDMWPSNIMKNTKQKEKIKETVNDLNDNYEKHNEIIIDKLADMYYNAYKNTYGYEENPLTKSEFKRSFSNVTGTLLPSGKLEGYVESHEYGDDSFGTDYYFMYDILNKTLSDVEND